MAMAGTYPSIDEYIASCPGDVQSILEEIRAAIHGAVPGTGEKISYQIPTITLGGKNLVHFAAWKKHIAVYPIPDADEALERDLAPYQAAKGTLRFPLEAPVPYDLIGRVARALADQRHS